MQLAEQWYYIGVIMEHLKTPHTGQVEASERFLEQSI